MVVLLCSYSFRHFKAFPENAYSSEGMSLIVQQKLNGKQVFTITVCAERYDELTISWYEQAVISKNGAGITGQIFLLL